MYRDTDVTDVEIDIDTCRCQIMSYPTFYLKRPGKFLRAQEWSGLWWASCGLAAANHRFCQPRISNPGKPWHPMLNINFPPPHPPHPPWNVLWLTGIDMQTFSKVSPSQTENQTAVVPPVNSLSWDFKSVHVRKLVFPSHFLGFLRLVKSQFWFVIEMFGWWILIFSAWLVDFNIIFFRLIQCNRSR